MAFHIVRNDIVKMNVDALVNSSNPEPTYAYGTDLAIYTAAGADSLLKERKNIGRIEPGTSAVTSAGKLSANYIIHTVAPLWEGGERDELKVLKSCYETALEKAYSLHCGSIAFPLLATGVYGFPKDQALEVAMTAIQTFLLKHQMDVFLVVFDQASFVLTGQVFDEIQAYVDENYVADISETEYTYPKTESKESILSSDDIALRNKTLRELRPRIPPIPRRQAHTMGTIVDGLENESKTFQEKLFEYIDQKNIKSSDIYRPIAMSRQQYSKMQNNRNYHPKKNTALLLALVLKLNLYETQDILSRAGYALNPSSKQDIIVKACIVNQQYDLFFIDAILQNNGIDTLIDYEGKQGCPMQ